MPFRSEPEEAAVAECSAPCRRGRGDLHAVEVDLEFLRDDLRHLDEEPLPHLGAAVVQMHRAVLVDVHQRAGLVQVRGGEGDAEFHRRQRDALLQDRVLAR